MSIHPRMVYLIPSFQCNLNCPHCHIKNQPETFNREAFIQAMNDFHGYKLLFGGEPFHNKERSFEIYNASVESGEPIESCSTNLLVLDDEIMELFTKINVCTSWNLTRFTDEQYTLWKSNIDKMAESGKQVMVLITMTRDLLRFPKSDFLDIVRTWNLEGISEIKMEHYIGDDNDDAYYAEADQWLTDLFDVWDLNIAFPIKDPEEYWYRDCREIFSLLPDGTLVNVCPQGSELKRVTCTDCYKCDRSDKCMPCRFHSRCSYPRRLAAKLNAAKEESAE